MTPKSLILLLLALVMVSCDDDDNNPITFEVPSNYDFTRNGQSTVAFDGQTTRIAMAEALVSAMSDPTNDQAQLDAMFRNTDAPFTDADLNASDKSLRSKVAASRDYFFADATTSAAVRADLDAHLAGQANEVFPNWMELAEPGQAGQIADGSRTRYVNALGVEYNQAFAKSLIGALMLDQVVNNYLSPAVLDEARNLDDNDAGTLEDGKNYTTMEHKWDEAYGYLFGLSADPTNPLATLGEDDGFLNEYVGRVNDDEDFAGIAETIYEAFITGRAAIVGGDHAERDRQAQIIQENLSKVLAVRGVFYLARGTASFDGAESRTGGFHALSEAYGFIYSLQFTRNPTTGAPYFSRTEVQALLDQLTAASDNGLWDVPAANINAIAQAISDRFGFSMDNAAN